MATKPWGVYQPGAPGDMSQITSLASLVGASPAYVLWFKDWAGSFVSYTASDFTNVLNAGMTPILTWQPNDNTQITHISHAMILAGNYNTIIDAYANGIKALSGTVFIRLAHEMNGTWYDWAVGNNGNTTTSYINMWQYVVGRFRSAGCTNVKWVYCPNIEFAGSSCTFAGAYPGDSYVDYLALDGYNIGTDGAGHTWVPFSTLFNTSITDLVAVAPTKPFFIAEMGCSEQSGFSKAAWLEDAIGIQIRRDSRISFFCYFNEEGTSAFHNTLSSSTDTTLAFKSSLVPTISTSAFTLHI